MQRPRNWLTQQVIDNMEVCMYMYVHKYICIHNNKKVCNNGIYGVRTIKIKMLAMFQKIRIPLNSTDSGTYKYDIC